MKLLRANEASHENISRDLLHSSRRVAALLAICDLRFQQIIPRLALGPWAGGDWPIQRSSTEALARW